MKAAAILVNYISSCVFKNADGTQIYFLINQISLIKVTYLASVERNIVELCYKILLQKLCINMMFIYVINDMSGFYQYHVRK